MYSYEKEKPNLFNDEGQRMFLGVRDNVQHILKVAGAVRMTEAMKGATGSTWMILACVDRMVELGELRELIQPGLAAGQCRVFVAAKGDQ